MSGHRKWDDVKRERGWEGPEKEYSEPTINELREIQVQLGQTFRHLVWLGHERFVIAHTNAERDAYENGWESVPLECDVHIAVATDGPGARYGYYYYDDGEFTPVPSQQVFRAMFNIGKAPGCDAEEHPLYINEGLDGAPNVICRCVVCPHCQKHTGNSNQGHYWAYCKVTKTKREFHFCCPDNCELETSDV